MRFLPCDGERLRQLLLRRLPRVGERAAAVPLRLLRRVGEGLRRRAGVRTRMTRFKLSKMSETVSSWDCELCWVWVSGTVQ